MDKNVFIGKWKQARGQIKVSWAKLAHHNKGQAAGKFDQFVGVLQEKYGITRARVSKAVSRRAHGH
jgi:uncharacterized protein YjbJ (UPF0337 family)